MGNVLQNDNTLNPASTRHRTPSAVDNDPDTEHNATDQISDSQVTLDKTNLEIIRELENDGRRSYAAIGRAVGLSEAAVRQRVQRLLDQDVIQIVAISDPLQVGLHRQAMIGIKTEGNAKEIARVLGEIPQADYVVMCAGSFDLLVEVVCENDDVLLRLLNEEIRSIPGVKETETFVYLKLAKQTYAWSNL